MSACEHDPLCPGVGPAHDRAVKLGTRRLGPQRPAAMSVKAHKRLPRIDRWLTATTRPADPDRDGEA